MTLVTLEDAGKIQTTVWLFLLMVGSFWLNPNQTLCLYFKSFIYLLQ